MNLDFPVYQVIVVGFHHKKGCQIEYAFPPLERELEKTAWKYLPTLAMPDGAHNFQHDTVYFHLPSLTKPNETVFGVACYQQIDTEKLKIKAEDVTRSTVQKSVCVLSKYPLYGHIQVKMQLITAAYFREGDFSQVSILEEAFHNLNACLEPDLLRTPEAFVGLSPRDLVFLFRHQILTLFKLLLLEKKVLFRGASVGPLCSALLTLISLLPLQLEYGLSHSACIRTAKTLSMVPQFSTESQNAADLEDAALQGDKNSNMGYTEKPRPPAGRSQVMSMSSEKHQTEDNVDHANSSKRHRPKLDLDKDQIRKEHCDKSAMELDTLFSSFAETVVECTNPYNLSGEKSNASPSPPYSPAEPEVETPEKCVEVPDFQTAVEMTPSDAGLPLSLFTKGYLCHPYLSLHYMDLLTDARVRGFVIGTTNVLFKQKKDLVDVIVEMEDGSVEFMDPNLKRQVGLTTPDMRFADNVVKQVLGESGGGGSGGDGDSFMDGVGYEGGDEWIRAQFKYYLMSLMRTSLSEESSRQRESFGVSYLNNWQDTNNWRVWSAHVNSEERKTPGIYSLCPGHPFEGAISVQDMKIRLAHTMQNTEGGRRLNQAVVSTGKAMAQTGKAVGGAISTAKGALSSWWNTVTTPVASEVSAPTDEPRAVPNSPVSPVLDSNRQ